MLNTVYLVYEKSGWLATPATYATPQEARLTCCKLAGNNCVVLGDMARFLERDMYPCRYKGDNGEFFIRGRLVHINTLTEKYPTKGTK